MRGYRGCLSRVMWGASLGLVFCTALAAQAATPSFPTPGMSIPDYWGEPNVWWDGRATFSGQVVVPACTLAMEDAWQSVDLGETPVRDLQVASAGPEKHFQLRLMDCELAGTGKSVLAGSRVRVTFDGVQGSEPDHFRVVGQATGIDLQVIDNQGYSARSGEPLPAQPLYGDGQGLEYRLRVVRNGQPLNAGNYYAALRFRVEYE